MSKLEMSLSASSASIEATQRGFIVWLHDATGRTIGDVPFHMEFESSMWGGVISRSIDAAYQAAAAYADRVNSNA